MKAISIRQPWVWMILNAGKRRENRDWKAPPRFIIGETILIHASATFRNEDVYEDFLAAKEMASDEAWAEVQARFPEITLRMLKEQAGGLVARARVVDAVWNGDNPDDPWAVPGAVGIILADVVPLPALIPYKGALGFFDVPDSVLR